MVSLAVVAEIHDERVVEERVAAIVGGFKFRRELRDEVEPIEDLLAGGATLEDLAAETRLQSGEITWYEGLSSFGARNIDRYDEFRSAAAVAAVGDFPEVLELADGGIFALRLDEVIEPALRPFDEVKEAVTEGWQAQETRGRSGACGFPEIGRAHV